MGSHGYSSPLGAKRSTGKVQSSCTVADGIWRMVYGVWRRGQTWLSDLTDWRSSTSLSIFQLRFMSWLRSFHLKSASISRRRRGVQLIRLSSTSPKDQEEEPRKTFLTS